MKLASAGLGWKDSTSGVVLTERLEDFSSLQWTRSIRGGGFQLRLELNSGAVRTFEGFDSDSIDALMPFCSQHYGLVVSRDECSGRGWNWGQLSLDEATQKLAYHVGGKLAFTLPASQVSNTLVAAKNELVCEFGEGIRAGEALDDGDDVVTEIRFYLPDEIEESEVEVDDDVEMKESEAKAKDADEERMDIDSPENSQTSSPEAAKNLATSLMERIKILSAGGKDTATGDVIAALPEIGFTVPRGRYRIDMFDDCLRLHGKSYDYRIGYPSIKRLFLLPKLDDAHIMLVMAIDPPLRQGQTRYTYLIMQFPKEEVIESLTLENIDLAKYDGKLQPQYNDQCTFEVVSALLRGLAGQKIVVPGGFKSVSGTNAPALKCTIKANEGALYVLEKSFLFLPKPTLLIPHAEIEKCIFGRVGAGFGNPRSFDLKITAKGLPEQVFSNINKDELDNLMDFLQSKQIPFQTEQEATSASKKSKKPRTDDSQSDDDDDLVIGEEGGEEDDESTDEDYQEGDSEDEDGSDYDSEEDSDFDSEEDSGDSGDEEEEEEEDEEDEDDE